MHSTSQNFSAPETWRGGYYEIEFDLGAPSDERVALTLETLWLQSSIEGCYLSRKQEPDAQARVKPGQYPTEGHLYGVATLPNGARAACGTYVCKLQNEDGVRLRDLVEFYIPLGALGRTYEVGGYPFADADDAATWRVPLDEWLVELGRCVFERVPFGLALVGFEVDVPTVSGEVVRQKGIPTERFEGYLMKVGENLEWYPPTNWNLVRFSEESK